MKNMENEAILQSLAAISDQLCSLKKTVDALMPVVYSGILADDDSKKNTCTTESQLESWLDHEEKEFDEQVLKTAYNAICPEISKPLSVADLKRFGYQLDENAYAKYIEDYSKQETALS